MNRNSIVLGIAALAAAAAFGQKLPPATKSAPHISAASATRGKEVFAKKCALCHYPDRSEKKIGPGLKGISKRGTFTTNSNRVNAESLKAWIENGDSLMPPFKDTLEPAQIRDVVAYVKTL